MGSDDQTTFSQLFPRGETKKAEAAKGLFQLLGKMTISVP
jgi:hypothetical protein